MSHQRPTAIEDGNVSPSDGGGQELKRNFSPLAMLGLAFAILNSWTALSIGLSLSLPSGGPTSVLWGLITAGFCNMCMAASLAEFLSAYPTAGGQYHWVAIISWKRWMPLLSWIAGWISVFGWIALTATAGLGGSLAVTGVISLQHPGYTAQRWHQFLIYIGYNLVAFLINAFWISGLPHINKIAIIWSIAGFAIVCTTVLACSSPNYNPPEFVFTEFINLTGWPDGVALRRSVAHDEEIPNPTIEGPKIMIYCIAIGTVTGFIFLTCLLFVAGPVETVIESTAGPLLQIIFDATQSRAGAVCLMIFPLVCSFFASTAVMTTSSRMTYAFARDQGIPYSRIFARLHPIFEVPLNALLLTAASTILFGCIFLGSSGAFNAIASAAVVALSVSYAMPVTINLLQGRRMLPDTRHFKLRVWLAWPANIIAVVYAYVTTVLFVFPPTTRVTGNTMNYAIVVFGIVIIISLVQWVVDGRKNYTGPRFEGELSVLTAAATTEDAVHARHVDSLREETTKGICTGHEGL